MKILALDTSGKTLSIALKEGEALIGEILLDLGRHHSEILFPVIDTLFKKCGLNLGDIQLLVTTVGPGSFTGVRVGVSVVKGLSLATGIPVVGVSTLASLAMNVISVGLPVCALIDARRDQVYCGVYERDDSEGILCRIPDKLTYVSQLFSLLQGHTILVGDGVLRYRSFIEEKLKETCRFASDSEHAVRATHVGTLGLYRFRKYGPDDPLSLVPQYIRQSSAEEKLGNLP